MNKERIKSYDLPYIRQAAEIIRKTPSRMYTITELALEVNINTYKLREGFKQLFKVTVNKYQSQVHLEIAKEMLEDTDRPIKQIAKDSGFGCQSTFSRRFRQIYKMSPREWRQERQSGAAPPATGGFVCAEGFCSN
jgi:AraC-like DNA-binding protein